VTYKNADRLLTNTEQLLEKITNSSHLTIDQELISRIKNSKLQITRKIQMTAARSLQQDPLAHERMDDLREQILRSKALDQSELKEKTSTIDDISIKQRKMSEEVTKNSPKIIKAIRALRNQAEKGLKKLEPHLAITEASLDDLSQQMQQLSQVKQHLFKIGAKQKKLEFLNECINELKIQKGETFTLLNKISARVPTAPLSMGRARIITLNNRIRNCKQAIKDYQDMAKLIDSNKPMKALLFVNKKIKGLHKQQKETQKSYQIDLKKVEAYQKDLTQADKLQKTYQKWTEPKSHPNYNSSLREIIGWKNNVLHEIEQVKNLFEHIPQYQKDIDFSHEAEIKANEKSKVEVKNSAEELSQKKYWYLKKLLRRLLLF